mmetsp:Transcript_35678/g.114103  ORF Transcript_35678/g.114103 Transcript_35678/m.114103 type:complete len:288 (+) Transcript_35678:1991-2854(+)
MEQRSKVRKRDGGRGAGDGGRFSCCCPREGRRRRMKDVFGDGGRREGWRSTQGTQVGSRDGRRREVLRVVVHGRDVGGGYSGDVAGSRSTMGMARWDSTSSIRDSNDRSRPGCRRCGPRWPCRRSATALRVRWAMGRSPSLLGSSLLLRSSRSPSARTLVVATMASSLSKSLRAPPSSLSSRCPVARSRTRARARSMRSRGVSATRDWRRWAVSLGTVASVVSPSEAASWQASTSSSPSSEEALAYSSRFMLHAYLRRASQVGAAVRSALFSACCRWFAATRWSTPL